MTGENYKAPRPHWLSMKDQALEAKSRAKATNRKEPPPPSPALPQGFAPVAVSVYRRGRTLIITGDVDPDKDPESKIHNCDAQGCAWEHVLAMVPLTPEQEKQFEVLRPHP